MNLRLLLSASTFLFSTLLTFAQTTKKPNVIFILVDDMGYGDIGVFLQNQRKKTADRSEPWMLTPQLDKMAAEGAMLPQQYCAAPVCAPSRASILLGVNQGHANVRDNQFDKGLENNYTLGTVMQRLGYKTVAIGKWGLQGGGKKVAPNWPAHPNKRGFDDYYGYIAHGDGHEHYPKEGIYRNAKQVWDNTEEVSAQLDNCYTGDLFTARAKKYILDHVKGKENSKPFMMYLAYDTPHAVLELATGQYPKGGGLKGGLQWIGKPGLMINSADGKPDSYMHPDYANQTYDEDKDPLTPEIPWPDTYKRYASVVRRIDDQVGDLLQLLKDLKIDKNTMVVFTSDNGPSKESYLPDSYVKYDPDFFNNFGPFDGIKRDVLEGGVREPTVAWWPGTIPAGKVINSPSISYDWLPTFTNAAGAIPPARTDGVSLLPSLTGKGIQQKSSIYLEYFQNAKTPNYKEFAPQHRNKLRNQMQMIRLGDTVALRTNIQSGNDDFEIYDIIADPQQIKNLAFLNPVLQQRFKARALQSRRPDAQAVRPYDTELVAANKVNSIRPGLSMKVFTTSTVWLPELSNVKASATARVTTLKPSGGGNTFLFEGYLKVPADGEYVFSMSADNKAFLRIHDSAIIDEDFGYKGGQIKEGKIRLSAGYHAIKITCMAKTGTKKAALSLQWTTNGALKSEVPATAFFN